MNDPSALIGFVAIGAVLVLVALAIVLVTLPIARRLPASPGPQFTPPPGDVVAHGLALRADRRVLTAALIQLAVDRRIRILAPRGQDGPVAIEALPGAGLTPEDRLLLQAFRPARMRPRQRRRYLRALREIGISVARVEDAPDVSFLTGPAAFRGHRRRRLAAFVGATRERMKSEGIAKPVTNAFHLVLLSLLFLAAAAVGLLLLIGSLANGQWAFAPIAIAVVAALFGVLLLAPPPLLRFTDRGRELRRHLASLREYMRLAEQDRLRMLQSPEGALRTPAGALTAGGQALGLRPQPTADDAVGQSSLDRIVLIERLLPYAILFRQERAWQNELAHLGGLEVAQNLRVLGTTLEGVMVVLEALQAAGQVLRFFGGIFALVGRLGS